MPSRAALKKLLAKELGVFLREAQDRSEEARFMTAARMGRTQGVVAELGDIHDGTVTARQLHFHERSRSGGNPCGETVGFSIQTFGSDEAQRAGLWKETRLFAY